MDTVEQLEDFGARMIAIREKQTAMAAEHEELVTQLLADLEKIEEAGKLLNEDLSPQLKAVVATTMKLALDIVAARRKKLEANGAKQEALIVAAANIMEQMFKLMASAGMPITQELLEEAQSMGCGLVAPPSEIMEALEQMQAEFGRGDKPLN